MAKSLNNLMIKDFISELSSSSPTPGGGGAAALSASLACALCAMVFNLTINKKKFNEYDERTKKLVLESLDKVEQFKDEFLKFMDKDADAFMELMYAFKLPKDTEEDKKIREVKLQQGFKSALKAPLELAKMSGEIFDYILVGCNYGSNNVISDAGVAAMELNCAVKSAVMNVNINLSSISDEKYKSEIKDICDKIISDSTSKTDKILSIVNSKI